VGGFFASTVTPHHYYKLHQYDTFYDIDHLIVSSITEQEF